MVAANHNRGLELTARHHLVERESQAVSVAIVFGEGAEWRRPLGITNVGGLLVSQLLTLYTTPVIYLYLDHLRLWVRRPWRIRQPQLADEGLAEPGE